MSTIPKTIKEKIEEFSGRQDVRYGVEYGYSLALSKIEELEYELNNQKGNYEILETEYEQLATDGREELEKALAYIKDTLDDCREYMDDKADVDVDNDYFVPNKEAKLLSRIDSTIEKLNKHYERK